MFTIPVSFSLFLAKKQKILFIVFLILLICFLLTFSVGGTLSFFVATMVFFKLAKFKNHLFFYLFLIIICLCVIIFRIDYLLNSQGPILLRLENWKTTFSIIKNYPFGTGFGTYAIIYPKYKSISGNEIRFAHNSYLQIWSELGIFGFIAFLWLLSETLFVIFNKISNLKGDTQLIGIGLFIGIIAFLVHNFIDFNFYIPNLTLLCFYFIGLIFVFDAKETKAKQSFLLTFIFIFIMLFVVYRIYFAELYFKKGYYSKNLMKSGFYYKKAIRLVPLNYKYHLQLGYIYLIQQDYKNALLSYQQAIKLNPMFSKLYYDIGKVYLGLNRKKEAIASIKKAITLYPTCLEYRKFLKEL